jgi:hypothetical protein
MRQGHGEWDIQLIQSCLYPHDAEEVQKIRLSERISEDHIVWHYERSGIFTVKSAYRLDCPRGTMRPLLPPGWYNESCESCTVVPESLGLQIDQQEKQQEGSSSRADESRAPSCRRV